MLDKEEMGQLRDLLREEMPVMIREEVKAQLQIELKDVVRRPELEAMFIASERRIVEHMVEIVGNMVDDNITPQIQELRHDIASIKRGRWQLA